MCLEYVLTDSIDIDYGSVLSSQRKQDIIAGIYLSMYPSMYPSIHLIYIYLSMYSIYVSIHPSLPIYLTIISSIYPSIHPSIPGITSSQESLFNTSFHFLQHLTSEMSTYTDENTLRYVNLFCTTVRTHVLNHLTYSCSVLLYVHMYSRAYVDPVSSLLGLLRVLAAVVKVS